MIHAIKGIVSESKKQAISVEMGPIVLDLYVPDESQFSCGHIEKVFTYLHWNQEQGPILYGFKNIVDRSVFELIISCSGIGPRIALAVLADIGATGFITAIQKEDERILSKVNGIGIKKAEQIIVQLRHKVNNLLEGGILSLDGDTSIDWHTMSEALKALNYSRGEINSAISYIRKNNDLQSATFDQLLRKALSFLSKQV